MRPAYVSGILMFVGALMMYFATRSNTLLDRIYLLLGPPAFQFFIGFMLFLAGIVILVLKRD